MMPRPTAIASEAPGFIGAAELTAALPWADAVAALEAAFMTERPDGPARSHVAVPDGAQARSHVHAMRAVREIEYVAIVGRDRARAARLVDALVADGIDAVLAGPD